MLENIATLTLLNTGILTAYGTFVYEPLTVAQARALVHEFHAAGRPVQSAIGHQATAELLARLLAFPVPLHRLNFVQGVNDAALVFKLKSRVPEGLILSLEEMEALGYEFGWLRRQA